VQMRIQLSLAIVPGPSQHYWTYKIARYRTDFCMLDWLRQWERAGSRILLSSLVVRQCATKYSLGRPIPRRQRPSHTTSWGRSCGYTIRANNRHRIQSRPTSQSFLPIDICASDSRWLGGEGVINGTL
jgi:hypothetical protein